MTDESLLTLQEAADVLRLRTAETFSRFARRHEIPLVRFGSRVVRVRAKELDAAIRSHEQLRPVKGASNA